MLKLVLRGFVVFFFMILSACTHVSKQDGPPNFYVDVSRIPNATPKREPMSKYGNMQSYVVNGKRYYTLASSENYEEIGRASWYGTKFHAARTSSGERYNMLGMTAAHKTLPLPTYVEVTNLRNQQKVIVKVNDRGPFVSTRLIDLSYVAARKLGMTGTGTTLVRVKAIDVNHYSPNNATPVVVAENNHIPQRFLQIGVFRQEENARQLKRSLSPLIKNAIIVTYQYPLYRVKIGPLADDSSVKHVTKLLKRYGVTPINKEA